MPCVGNQIVYMIDHVSVRSDNGYTARNTLHPRRVIGSVKAFWRGHRALCRVIRKKQGQDYSRMRFLRLDDRFCSQPVKAPIVAYNKLCHTIFDDVLLNSGIQLWIHFFTRLSMSDKKQLFPPMLTPLAILAFIVKIIRYK